MVLLPGDTGCHLETSVVVTAEGAPGIEQRGLGVLLSPPENDVAHVPSAEAPSPFYPGTTMQETQ